MKLKAPRAEVFMKFHDLALYAIFVLWAALTFSPALAEISFVVALAAWCVWKIPQNFRMDGMPKIIWIPLAVFLLWIFLSWPVSEYPSKSFRGITKILQQLLLFLMTADLLRTREGIRKFEKVFLFVAWVILLDGIFQYCFEKDFLRGHWVVHSRAGSRIAASFGSYGKFASYLICILPYLGLLGLYYRKAEKDLRRSCLALLVFSGSLGLLLLTRSRGAFLAFGAALVFMFLIRRKFLWLVLFLAAFLGGACLLPKGMLIHLDSEFKEQSLVERYYLWRRAVDVIRAKPIFGTGINTYAVAHQKYDRTQNWRVRNYYAHNGYLQMAAETGLPGLLFFLIFLFAYFFYSFQPFESPPWDHRFRLALLTGLFSFLVFSAVDTVLHNEQPALTFWFLMGLQLAYRHRENGLECAA